MVDVGIPVDGTSSVGTSGDLVEVTTASRLVVGGGRTGTCGTGTGAGGGGGDDKSSVSLMSVAAAGNISTMLVSTGCISTAVVDDGDGPFIAIAPVVAS